MNASHDTGPRIAVSPTMVLILQARALEATLQKKLEEIGLSLRRLGLLGHLQREPGISFSALARRAGIKVQSLHPIVATMMTDGYVDTVGGVDQGRAAAIELTDAGIEALSRAHALIAQLDVEMFGDGEWAKLGEALTDVGEAQVRTRTPR